MKFGPKSEAVAFRIWQYCSEREWNVSADDIAADLEIAPTSVGRVIRQKGWYGRLRISKRELREQLRVEALSAAASGALYVV